MYRFRRVTLPLMLPAIITMSMLSTIATFNSFDIIWILTQGGPNGSTTTMIIDTYQTAIGSKRYGEGAARAVTICIFLSLFCGLFPCHAAHQPRKTCLRGNIMSQPQNTPLIDRYTWYEKIAAYVGIAVFLFSCWRRSSRAFWFR